VLSSSTWTCRRSRGQSRAIAAATGVANRAWAVLVRDALVGLAAQAH
jgi:hypothetical protein